MTIGIPEVDAAAAVPIVELAVVEAPRRAAIGKAFFPYARENGVELGVADVKGQVVAFERGVVVEQQCQRLVHAHRCEMLARPVKTQGEKAREKEGRRFLVARRHDRMVERDRHRCPPCRYAIACAPLPGWLSPQARRRSSSP